MSYLDYAYPKKGNLIIPKPNDNNLLLINPPTVFLPNSQLVNPAFLEYIINNPDYKYSLTDKKDIANRLIDELIVNKGEVADVILSVKINELRKQLDKEKKKEFYQDIFLLFLDISASIFIPYIGKYLSMAITTYSKLDSFVSFLTKYALHNYPEQVLKIFFDVFQVAYKIKDGIRNDFIQNEVFSILDLLDSFYEAYFENLRMHVTYDSKVMTTTEQLFLLALFQNKSKKDYEDIVVTFVEDYKKYVEVIDNQYYLPGVIELPGFGDKLILAIMNAPGPPYIIHVVHLVVPVSMGDWVLLKCKIFQYSIDWYDVIQIEKHKVIDSPYYYIK